jgi:hypothetical protein
MTAFNKVLTIPYSFLVVEVNNRTAITAKNTIKIPIYIKI